MRKQKVYFVDENEKERRACLDVLVELLANDQLVVEAIPPAPDFASYTKLVASADTGAFILDQRLGSSGLVSYSGIELASYLRGISSKLPIYILTNYAGEEGEFANQEASVEHIESKRILKNPGGPDAQKFKARFLRHLEVFGDVLDKRESRFHELLVKSLKEKLSADEEKELGLLENERVLPMQAEELHDSKALQQAIEELKAKLVSDKLKM